MKSKYKVSNNGFTLVELLAVIVVLAIIAVIAVPVILGVIDKAKLGALKDSAYGLVEASELYLAKNMGKDIETKEFTCSNGTCLSGTEKISYKGNIDSGKIRIYSDSKIELCITNNKNAALKTVASEEVTVNTGTCNYDELNYGVVALVSMDDYVAKQAELVAKQAELDAKQAELDNLNNLILGTTAMSSDILEGKTAYTADGLTEGVLKSKSLVFCGNWSLKLPGNNYVTYSTKINIGSTIEEFSDLTINDIFVTIDTFRNYSDGANTASVTRTISKNYNSTTGILTLSLTAIHSNDTTLSGKVYVLQ